MKIKVYGFPVCGDTVNNHGCLLKVTDVVSTIDRILDDDELIKAKLTELKEYLSEFV